MRFVEQSRASLVCYHFLYSPELYVGFRKDIVGKYLMLVTHKGLRVNYLIINVPLVLNRCSCRSLDHYSWHCTELQY